MGAVNYLGAVMAVNSYENTKILAVDDEPMVLELVIRSLRREGFDVYSATDGIQGLKLFREINPVVILTDINMPEVTGFDILKTVKQESPTTQIIVFSGIGTTEDVINALRLGASDYLYKPFHIEFLVHTVMKCIERYELIRERIDRKTTLEKEIAERTATLKKTFHSTIASLGRMIEMRDPYTSGHQNRVSSFAVKIGLEMKLTQKELEVIKVAGLLHDIGKVAVPVELLVKPARLNTSEFALVKCHPNAGYKAIKDIPFIESLGKNVADIVHQHHERINGTGYPNRLKDDEIMLEAKILSVADVFEAMSTHRPYRAALNIEVAKQEIAEKSGEYFSPECVGACIRLIEKNKDSLEGFFGKNSIAL